MTTAREIVSFTLRGAGVSGLGQDPLSQDINDGFTLLVNMLAQWQVKRWLVPGLTDVSAVADGSISNKIGPGQFYNAAIRPDKILAAYFKQLNTGAPSVSYKLRSISSYEDYAMIALKDLTSFPGWYFYDGAWPYGNVFIWPKPTSQYEIHLITKLSIQNKTTIVRGSITAAGALYTNGNYLDVPLIGGSGSGAIANITIVGGIITETIVTNGGLNYNAGDTLTVNNASVGGTGAGFIFKVTDIISSLDTEINLPDEYAEAIYANLIVRITAHYKYPANPVQGVLAKTSLNVIKNANAQISTLNIPWANRTGFNIYAPDVYGG